MRVSFPGVDCLCDFLEVILFYSIVQERIAREANQLWIARDAEKCHELINRDGYTYVDIRSRREYNRECPKGSRCVPAVVVSGVSLDAKLQPEEDFGEMFKKDFPDLSSKLIVVCDSCQRNM